LCRGRHWRENAYAAAAEIAGHANSIRRAHGMSEQN
jgi:hypothetical protein